MSYLSYCLLIISIPLSYCILIISIPLSICVSVYRCVDQVAQRNMRPGRTSQTIPPPFYGLPGKCHIIQYIGAVSVVSQYKCVY
jgi:hypothetical protein